MNVVNFQSRCEFGCLERGTVGGYGFEVIVRSWYGAVLRVIARYDDKFLLHSAI